MSTPTDEECAYQRLTRRSQARRIRAVALAALEDYPIEPVRVRLVAHEYNTTFRVDTTDGRRFALRVNVNSRKQPGNLDAELAWLAALASDTDLAVPAPLPTRSGELRTTRWSDVLGRELPVVLMSWLPGPDLGDGSPGSLHALGRAMALLHEHAERWRPPSGTWFPTLDRVLVDQPDRLGGDHPALDDDGRAVLAATHRLAQDAYDSVASAGSPIALHADLHGGNVKWFRRRIAVFDFDDACTGVPVHDLAISTYYLRDDPAAEAAVFAGYATRRALPEVAPRRFEALLAARNLVLVNDVLGGIGAADREIAPAYTRNTVRKLRAFLESGTYRHEIDGLEPRTW